MDITMRRASRMRFLGAAGAAGAAAAFGTPVFGAGETLLRLSMPVPAATMNAIEVVRFTKLAEQKSNGSIKFENYFDNQLAQGKDVHAGILSGVVDMTIMSSPWLAAYATKLQVMDLPFLFSSRAAMFRVLDGELGRTLNADAADHGFSVLTWGAYGAVEFEQRDKRVKTPDDMKGLRVRVIASPISASIIRALGAIPVDLAIPELYVALQQKALDGMQITVTTLNAMKMNDVVKCLTITDSNLNSAPLVMSKKRFDGLTAQQQKALADAAHEWAPGLRAKLEDESKSAVEDFVKKGGAVDLADKPAFRKALLPVYEEYRKKLGADFVDRFAKAGAA